MNTRGMKRVGKTGVRVEVEIPLAGSPAEPPTLSVDTWKTAASKALMIFRDRKTRGDTEFRLALTVERVFDTHDEDPDELGKVKSGWSLFVRGTLFVPETEADGDLDDLVEILMSIEDLPNAGEAFGTIGTAAFQFMPEEAGR